MQRPVPLAAGRFDAVLRALAAMRYRLLAPQHVAPLVRDQDNDHAVEFALDLGRVYRTAAHDARSAGPAMGFRHAIDERQAALGQPGANLTPQVVGGAEAFINHDAEAAVTGLFG